MCVLWWDLQRCRSHVCSLMSFAGVWLVGLLVSGELFLWNKDKDLLKTVSAVPAVHQLVSSIKGSCKSSTFLDAHPVIILKLTRLVLRRFLDYTATFSAGFGERTESFPGRSYRTGVPLGVYDTSGSKRPAGRHHHGTLESHIIPWKHSTALCKGQRGFRSECVCEEPGENSEKCLNVAYVSCTCVIFHCGVFRQLVTRVWARLFSPLKRSSPSPCWKSSGTRHGTTNSGQMIMLNELLFIIIPASFHSFIWLGSIVYGDCYY